MSKITEFQKEIDEKKLNISQEEVIKMCDDNYAAGSIATLEMVEGYIKDAEPNIDDLLIVISLWKSKMQEKQKGGK